MSLSAFAPDFASAASSLTSLKALVEKDMEAVNRLILSQGRSDIALITDLASHIIAAGGKRLRPSLTIAAARLCGYTGDRHIRLAACVEFIHTATLLHDDVVDHSDLRRGTPTANAIWGNKSSVLVGDFLFSRAFQLMVADGSLEVLKILSDTATMISEGEVHQQMVARDLSVTQAIYEQVVNAKTAILFAAACELGAIVGEKPRYQESLRQYGHALGMAFQLTDDALDYEAADAELGKAIGDDFRDGKITLPVIFAYADGAPQERAFWERKLESESDLAESDLAHARTLLMQHQACARTREVARRFSATAREALAPLPPCAERDAMLEAAIFAVERSH